MSIGILSLVKRPEIILLPLISLSIRCPIFTMTNPRSQAKKKPKFGFLIFNCKVFGHNRQIYFLVDFCNLVTKKKGLLNPTKGFLKFKKINHHILTKKT